MGRLTRAWSTSSCAKSSRREGRLVRPDARDHALRLARRHDRRHCALLTLEAGGVVGEHPAALPQIFLVVAGSGWVQGGEGERMPIEQGRAAVWQAGEAHESGSEGGLTAIVIEADSLEPL